jgi:hypothetical protein
MLRISLGVLATIMVAFSASAAFAAAYAANTLKGLTGVGVVVESLNPEVEQDGLTKDQIKTDVELKLRMAGIKVFSEEEWLQTPGCQFLIVNAHLMRFKSGSYIYQIDVGLNQKDFLKRAAEIDTFATTWQSVVLGICSLSDGRNKVRNAVKDRVDKFIEDYLSVNPK